MMVGMFVLRLVAGALFAGHGSQKLFGWFGGHGTKGTAGYFESIGLTPALPLALLAGGAELAGSVLLAAGIFVPVATLLLAALMATAIASVHWKNGVWAQNGGVELPLVMAVVVFAVAAVGPGSISLDNLLGIDWAGAGWAAAAVIVGAAGSLLLLALARLGHRTHRGGPQPHAA